MKVDTKWSGRNTAVLLGYILRIGVIISGIIVLSGAIIYLFKYGTGVMDFSTFKGEPRALTNPFAIISDAVTFHGRGLIQFGLLILIATPVVRVILSAVSFALEKDRLYFFVALIVFAVLLFSLTGGHL
jgi:uncharacterized membrane protein